jgi:hypothetical protein
MEEEENIYAPSDSWLVYLQLPVTAGRIVVRGWHLLVALVDLAFVIGYFTVTSTPILNTPMWVLLLAIGLIAGPLTYSTDRFQRFLTFSGLPYLMRGEDQPPIMSLIMRPTVRLLVRVSNAFTAGLLYWWFDYAQFWLASVDPPFAFLLTKVLMAWGGAFAVFYGIDQWWGLRRTRVALIYIAPMMWVGLFVWAIAWFEVSHDIAICPPFLCRSAP